MVLQFPLLVADGVWQSEDDASPPGFYFRYGQRMRHWPAPEVAEKRGALRKQSSVDAWGYGFFLYELVTQGDLRSARVLFSLSLARIPYGDSTWLDDGVYQQTMHEVCIVPCKSPLRYPC